MTTENVEYGDTLTRSTTNVSYGVTNTYQDEYFIIVYRKYRSWSVSPAPWKHTLPYVVHKTKIWPGWYHITESSPAYSHSSTRSGHSWCKIDYIRQLAQSVELGNALNDAMNSVYDSARGQSFDAPIFLAEAGKTADLITSLAQKADRGAHILADYGSGRISKNALYHRMSRLLGLDGQGGLWKRYSDKASQAWLMYRYAISTGISDVENAARFCADVLLRKQPEVSFRGNRTVAPSEILHTCRYGDWDIPFLLGPSAGATMRFWLEGVCWATCSAWLKASPRNQSIYEANQLGVFNLPALIWEKIPWSFVADWALDIGNYLQRLPTLLELNVVDSGYHVTRHAAGTIRTTVSSDFSTTREYLENPVRFESISYNRSIWPNPAPVWTPEIRMNINRFVDAAALLRSIDFGRFRPR